MTEFWKDQFLRLQLRTDASLAQTRLSLVSLSEQHATLAEVFTDCTAKHEQQLTALQRELLAAQQLIARQQAEIAQLRATETRSNWLLGQAQETVRTMTARLKAQQEQPHHDYANALHDLDCCKNLLNECARELTGKVHRGNDGFYAVLPAIRSLNKQTRLLESTK